MPYLKKYNPEYVDYGDRNYPKEEIGYGDDEVFDRWDNVALTLPFADQINDFTMVVGEQDGEIGVKFYSDTVSYDGFTSDDEYVNWMDPIPIDEMDEERLDDIVEQIAEYYNVDLDKESDFPDSMITR